MLYIKLGNVLFRQNKKYSAACWLITEITKNKKNIQNADETHRKGLENIAF